MRNRYHTLVIRLLLTIGLLMGGLLWFRLWPLSGTIRGYFMRDYVRGDSLVAVRLPYTSGAEGYINVTVQQTLIGVTGVKSQTLSDEEFQALMHMREEWCQKQDTIFTEAEQTPNYILAVQCKPLSRQFELTLNQLPPEIRRLLIQAESH